MWVVLKCEPVSVCLSFHYGLNCNLCSSLACCLIHFEHMPLPSTVFVSLACHIVLRVAWRLCMTAPRGWPLPLDIRITFAPYRFRDRSIPELDEILDAKLSEVQDHMRTLMQKQVRVCQPPWFLCSCRCSGRYLLEDDWGCMDHIYETI